MKARRTSGPGDAHFYHLKVIEGECENEIAAWVFDLDAAGLAALILSVEQATTEARMARAIGLKRKAPK